MNDNELPRISVVMPVYNAVAYVADAMESIRRQTCGDFELLALDDGSTDGSLEILDRIAAQDERIQVVRREHGGYPRLLNEGVCLARGEFLARMDADDVAEPDRFERQVRLLEEHSQCAVVGGQALLIDSDGDRIAPLRVKLSHAEIDQELLSGRGSAIIHPAAMFRTTAVEQVGGYREDLAVGEDLDLYLRLGEQYELANLPEVVLQFRRHAASFTSQVSGATGLSTRTAIVQAALARRGRNASELSIKSFHQPQSLEDLYANWAGMALEAGNIRTALKYVGRLLRRHPWRAQTWLALVRVGSRRLLRPLAQLRTRRSASSVAGASTSSPVSVE
jgi:glycosyltransferase involved in cell wall biosynthesis